MAYKYGICHIPTGNMIGVCYDKTSGRSRGHSLSCWLAQKQKYLDKYCCIINEDLDTGILGFFITDMMTAENGFVELKTFTYTNKHTLQALITSFNFRFDIAMDLWNITYRHDLWYKLKEKNSKNLIPIPSEFEIVRIK